MVEVRLSSTGDPSRGRLRNRQPNEGVLGDELGRPLLWLAGLDAVIAKGQGSFGLKGLESHYLDIG